MPTPKGLKQKKILACPECGKFCAPMGLNNHIRLKHKIQVVRREMEFSIKDQEMLRSFFSSKEHSNHQAIRPNLIKLSASEISRIQREIVARGNYKDVDGNIMELVGGHKDNDDKIRRLIFMNKTKFLVEVWDAENDHENNVQAKHIF